jgi:BirA family biotin operon repressor/biotin-[acetyl-CoA-carboxylase] ligase
MTQLSADGIKDGLATAFMGQVVSSYSSIASTNDAAKSLALQDAPEGTLVITDEQTAGKGRRGRSWLAPRGSSLLISLILYPALAPNQVGRLTMASSLAVARAIEATTGLSVCFKWPNDILLGGKKAGGVLTETSVTGETLDYAVVGIGLNVNLDVRQIRPPACPWNWVGRFRAWNSCRPCWNAWRSNTVSCSKDHPRTRNGQLDWPRWGRVYR